MSEPEERTQTFDLTGRTALVTGGHGGDHLDQLHDLRGVEEMHADDVLRPLGDPGQLDDRQ